MSFTVQGQHVVVAGGGRSGLAAAELLLDRGARVTLSDLREPEGAGPLRARVATIDVGPHRAEVLAGADLVVLSPGVPADQPALFASRLEALFCSAEERSALKTKAEAAAGRFSWGKIAEQTIEVYRQCLTS